MAGFFQRIFPTKDQDLMVDARPDQTTLSYRMSQFDPILIALCLAKIKADPEDAGFLQQFLEFQQQAVLAAEKHDVQAEISYLQSYVHLFQSTAAEPIFITWKIQVLDQQLTIPRFILLPLIQNALILGYNTLAKYPLKIKMLVYEHSVSLDISNHVNHHILDQKDQDLIRLYVARLKQEFDERHTLIMNSNAHTFRSNLILRF